MHTKEIQDKKLNNCSFNIFVQRLGEIFSNHSPLAPTLPHDDDVTVSL